jgi:superfamily I DNA/RNA helicase
METFTNEQLNYINYDKLEDTKLIAVAGAGKTKCIIAKMNFIITKKILESDEILMITFSRFTKDDFLTKVKKQDIDTILESQIKTIDSFAKSIIDLTNVIDISLLSYRFMKYLENVSDEALESILNYLKELISKSETDLILSNNLNKILSEDKEVLERLAK